MFVVVGYWFVVVVFSVRVSVWIVSVAEFTEVECLSFCGLYVVAVAGLLLLLFVIGFLLDRLVRSLRL